MNIKVLFVKYKDVMSYLFFGLCTTIVNILVYWLMAHVMYFPTMLSTVIAWTVAVFFAYITNRKWVFYSEAKGVYAIFKEIVSFISFRLASGVFDWLCMFIFVDVVMWDDILVKLFANIVVIIMNYLASKLVIFKKNKFKEVSEEVIEKKNIDLMCKIICAMVAFAIAVLIVCCSMRIWEMDLKTPVTLSGDWILGMRVMKSMEENGILGHFISYRMGAPEIAHILDTPYQDFTTAGLLLLINFFVKNGFKTFYIVYFMNFGFAASFMYLLLSKFKINNVIAVSISVVFSLAPYHFARGFEHFELSNIAVIPIGLWLAFSILEEDFIIFKKLTGKYFIYWEKVFLYLCASIYLGFSYGYYPAFMIIIMGVAIIIKMINKRSFNPLLNEGFLIYSTGLAFFVTTLPNKIYNLLHGTNTIAGSRMPVESEIYALRLIQMLLPNDNTHFKFLSALAEKYNLGSMGINENSSAAMGLIASICFLILCVWFFYSYITRKKISISKNMDFLALSTLSFFLVCTFGGIGAIFAYFISPQIRCWNRGSIVIVCMSLTGGAILIDHFFNKINKKLVIISFSMFLILVAIIDQVKIYPSNWQSNYKESSAVYINFFSELEEKYPNIMVYQLPFTESYEVPALFREGSYGASLPYIFTNSIHWSYGGSRGRDEAARNLYVEEGISSKFLKGILNKGFNGVLVDTWAYKDNGNLVIDFYRQELNIKPIISSDHRYYFFKVDTVDFDNITDLYYNEELAERLINNLRLEQSAKDNVVNYLNTRNNDVLANLIMNQLFTREVYMSDTEFIENCFNKLLGRQVDEEGEKNWVAFLEAGNTRYDVVVEILSSEEFLNQIN